MYSNLRQNESRWVSKKDANALLHIWSRDAAIMKRQPGFISTQLHGGIRYSMSRPRQPHPVQSAKGSGYDLQKECR